MNINDKINILNDKILYYENNLEEHYRILREDLEILLEGDQEVILSVIEDIKLIIIALINERQALTNQG